jgi:DNA-binding NarL/FixJ family response regulator
MIMSGRCSVHSSQERSAFCALLIDADASFRQAIADILYMYFPLINVEEASDGVEAVSKVDYLRPNIVFTDVELPGQSGSELTKEIRQVYGNVVIVFLTAKTPPKYSERTVWNSADSYISKEDGSCIEQVLSRIEEAMALSSRSI